MAKLYYYYGTMGSTKTLTLLTSAYQFEEKNIPFLCMKPSVDTRCEENMIESRIGVKRTCVTIHPSYNIYSLVDKYNQSSDAILQDKLKWILIDEAQFLTEEQIDQLAAIVDEFDINVSCYGLRTDFKSSLFPGSKRLFELADTIEEIKSPCSCGRKSIINARIDANGKLVISGKQVMIGGDDSYIPLCRKCWKERITKENTNV